MILAPLAVFALTVEQKAAVYDRVIACEHRDHAFSRTNFPFIKVAMDQAEREAIDKMTTALAAVRDDLLGQVKRNFDSMKTPISWVNDLNLRKMNAVREAMLSAMLDRTNQGMYDISYEAPVRAYRSKITATPAAAIQAIKGKADFYITGLLNGDLLKVSQQILVQAISNGEPVAETMRKLFDAWIPFVGAPDSITDPNLLRPSRIETIVRTNLNGAYNTGRLTKLRDPELQPYLAAVEYSAILDNRTTEICQELDGKLFHAEDPALDNFTPPNHYNCRSVLVPVMIGSRDIAPGDFITNEEIGRVKDLMDPNFGGGAAYAEYRFNPAQPRAPKGSGPKAGEWLSGWKSINQRGIQSLQDAKNVTDWINQILDDVLAHLPEAGRELEALQKESASMSEAEFKQKTTAILEKYGISWLQDIGGK